MRSVHYCPATKKTLERKYSDLTTLEAFPSNAIYPTKVGDLLEQVNESSLFLFLLVQETEGTVSSKTCVKKMAALLKVSVCLFA